MTKPKCPTAKQTFTSPHDDDSDDENKYVRGAKKGVKIVENMGGSLVNYIGNMFTSKHAFFSGLEKGAISMGEPILIQYIEKKIIVGLIRSCIEETLEGVAADAAVDQAAGPVGPVLFMFQILTGALDIWDPQGYTIVLDNHTLNNGDGGGITGSMIQKTRTLMEKNMCLKHFPTQAYWNHPTPPLQKSCSDCLKAKGTINPPTKTGKAAKSCQKCYKNMKPTKKSVLNINGMFDFKKASDLQRKYFHSKMNFIADFIALNISHYRKGGKGTITPTLEHHKKLYVGHPSDLKHLSVNVKNLGGTGTGAGAGTDINKHKKTAMLIGTFILIVALFIVLNAKNKMSALISIFISLIIVFVLFLIAAKRKGIWPYNTTKSDHTLNTKSENFKGKYEHYQGKKKTVKFPPRKLMNKWFDEAGVYAKKMMCEGCFMKKDVKTKKYILDCGRKQEIGRYRKWKKINIGGKLVSKCVLTKAGCDKYSFYPFEGLENNKIDAPNTWDMAPQYLEWQSSNVNTVRNPYKPDDRASADSMGGYCRKGHSLVRQWCTGTKSNMRKGHKGKHLKGMYGTAPFKYYPDGTCKDTRDYCTKGAPIGKAVEYNASTEDCYVSGEQKFFDMIFGKVITDNVVAGFRKAAQLASYGVAWLGDEGVLPPGVEGLLKANVGNLLLLLGPPPADIIAAMEGGEFIWHDRRKILAGAKKAAEAVAHTAEAAGDCMYQAVTHGDFTTCHSLMNSVGNDAKAIGAYLKKWGVGLANSKALHQMDHLAKEGIHEFKKQFKHLAAFTEEELHAHFQSELNFASDMAKHSEQLAKAAYHTAELAVHKVEEAAQEVEHRAVEVANAVKNEAEAIAHSKVVLAAEADAVKAAKAAAKLAEKLWHSKEGQWVKHEGDRILHSRAVQKAKELAEEAARKAARLAEEAKEKAEAIARHLAHLRIVREAKEKAEEAARKAKEAAEAVAHTARHVWHSVTSWL